MTGFWVFMALLVWGSRMVGLPFLQTQDLLQHPDRFVSSTYAAGALGLLSLALLARIFPARKSKLACVFGVLAYYLLTPDWMRLFVAPLGEELGDFLILVSCWLILSGRVGGFVGALGLLLGSGWMGWLRAPGLISLALAGLVFLGVGRLVETRFWRSLAAPFKLALSFVLGYALFLNGELELNRRLIVPFQRETHTFPLRLLAPDLAWMVRHDAVRLGLTAEDSAAIGWLAGQARASAVVYTPGEPFESAQTHRIYAFLCRNLDWCGWDGAQPNWGLNWIRQGGRWGGCGVDLIVVRGSEPREEPAFRQGPLCVYRNRGVPEGEQPARSVRLRSDGQPGGAAAFEVEATGPIIAVEEDQLPYLVLEPGENRLRLPWECQASHLLISGGLGMSLPALSRELAWKGLQVTDLSQQRSMGCSSIAGLRFTLANEGRLAVDLSGVRGVQLMARFSDVQPVLPLRGVLKPGQSMQVEVPWNSPPRPVKGQLSFYWVDAQGRNQWVGQVPIHTWYRVAPAQYYAVGP